MLSKQNLTEMYSDIRSIPHPEYEIVHQTCLFLDSRMEKKSTFPLGYRVLPAIFRLYGNMGVAETYKSDTINTFSLIKAFHLKNITLEYIGRQDSHV